MRAGMREELTDYRAHFEHYRRLFFFCDTQPENDRRFNIAFEDCCPAPLLARCREP